MSARTKRLREEHWYRPVAVVKNAFARLESYTLAMKYALTLSGPAGLRNFKTTHSYVGRGKHKAKWNSSRAALTRRPEGKVYPHDSKRESDRHVTPNYEGWHFDPYGVYHPNVKHARNLWAQDALNKIYRRTEYEKAA